MWKLYHGNGEFRRTRSLKCIMKYLGVNFHDVWNILSVSEKTNNIYTLMKTYVCLHVCFYINCMYVCSYICISMSVYIERGGKVGGRKEERKKEWKKWREGRKYGKILRINIPTKTCMYFHCIRLTTLHSLKIFKNLEAK